jgi:TolA-binding protein
LVLQFPDSDLADNAYYNLGIIYKRLEKFGKALIEFKTVVKHYPDSDAAIFAPDEIEALNELSDPACELFYEGQTLMIQKKNEEAQTIFKRITTEYPNSDLIDNAWLSLAQISIRSGSTATAIQILDRIERDFAGTDAAALVPDMRKSL